MKDSYDDKDFEQFVRQNADQYRMFPSENVWKGIHNTLHTRRRWYGIGLAFLLLTTTVVTWVMLTTPAAVKKQASATAVAKNATVENTTAAQPVAVLVAPALKPVAETRLTSVTTQFLTRNTPSLASPANIVSALYPLKKPVEINVVSALSNETLSANPQAGNTITKRIAARPADEIETQFISQLKNQENGLLIRGVNTAPLSKMNEVPLEDNLQGAGDEYDPYLPTIESVINAYKYTPKKKRLSWQVYLAPTISYRKLRENKSFLESARVSSGSVSTWVPDVNSVVAHKPDIGFETGFGTRYPLSKSLSITAGLQFNVSKYDISAYTFPGEIATIALNSSWGRNSVSTFTNYRNYGDLKTNWLRNLYISASLPVGMEWVVARNKKSFIGVGGTIQPTYILANRAYLISTDYKNYAEVPSLNRRWNANTSFEIFAGNTTGKLKWKVGPQVRYQALSSFVDKYPIKENLFDFGVKVGVLLK